MSEDHHDDSIRVICSGNQVLLDGDVIALATDEFTAQCIVDALMFAGVDADKQPPEVHDRLCKLFD